MSRRRAYSERRLRLAASEFLITNVRPLLALVGLYAASIGIGHLLGGEGYRQGFVDGSLLIFVVASVGLLFLLHTGALNYIAGSYGERRTREELHKAKRRGDIWDHIPNIELERGDIDCIVLAPAGVLALEVKWKTGPLDRRYLAVDAEQARRNAAKTRSVLLSANTIKEKHDVTPVLVIWGQASHDLQPGGEEIDGVQVVDGNELGRWLTRCSRGRMAQDNAERATEALKSFADSLSSASAP